MDTREVKMTDTDPLVAEIHDYMRRLYIEAVAPRLNVIASGEASAVARVLEKLANCVLLRRVQQDFTKIRESATPTQRSV